MNSDRLEQWVRQIAATEIHEISCSECLDRVSEFVDAELGGGPPARLAPVAQHLGQCQVCQEEYETLHELAELEQRGRTPSVDDLLHSL